MAVELGIRSPEAMRNWVRQAEVDTGQRVETTSEEAAEIERLRRENAELKADLPRAPRARRGGRAVPPSTPPAPVRPRPAVRAVRDE
ncbi:hypothetical protein ACQEU6_01440 [Spirillospora sp. CA-108201]